MGMKILVAATANGIRLLDTYAFIRRTLIRSQIAILMYHRVGPQNDNWSLETTSLENFEKQIRYLSRNYEILLVEQLAQLIREGKDLPTKAVVITFDDGYRDNYVYGFPILRKYHVPATIFLSTGHIGTHNLFWWDKVSYLIHHTEMKQLGLGELGTYQLNSEREKSLATSSLVDRLKKIPDEQKNLAIGQLARISGVDIPGELGKKFILSWQEVIEMSRNGVSFGSHTVNHPILTNLTSDQAKWEIVQSKKDIEEKIGKKVLSFSYPNGNFNQEIVAFLEKSGYGCAVAVSPYNLISRKNNIYTLSRIGTGDDFNIFKVMFCGLWGDLQSIRGRLRN
jgi:peptidoglycan/xylan/chitin deacetylase (PgdA/CDA1 family)